MALKIITTIASIIIESFCVSFFLLAVFTFINKDGECYYNDKKRFLRFWLINSICVILNRIIHIFLPDLKWLKPISPMLVFPLSAYINYKIKYFKVLLSFITFLITEAIFEVIGVLILKPFDINNYTLANNLVYTNLYASILAVFELLLAIFIVNLSNAIKTNFSSTNDKLKYFLPQLTAIVVCLIPSMLILILNYYKYSALFIVINLFQLIVVTFVGIYNLRFVVKHENTEIELANTITYNETLKKVNEGVRGFKHDMGNIVQAILGYIAVNDSEGAKKYCQNLVIGFNDINILSILSPKVIDDPAIYGVVVNKILMARDKNMTLSLDVNLNVSEINFPMFELSRILGILIDNAIEAGETTEEKKLVVNMYHDFNKNADIIVISNSINNIDIDTTKIFEKDYSTKENPSGFGLYEVNKFLKDNPQSYIVTTVNKDEKMFTQTLIIKSKRIKLKDAK